MIKGLRNENLRVSFTKRQPKTLTELLKRAYMYIRVDDAIDTKKKREDTGQKRKDKDQEEKRSSDKKHKSDQKRKDRSPIRRFASFTPLKMPINHILNEVQGQRFVRWPNKMKSDPKKRNKDKWCVFHRDHGHLIEECYDLKNEIENLIKKGYLKEFVDQLRTEKGKALAENEESKQPDLRQRLAGVTPHTGYTPCGCAL